MKLYLASAFDLGPKVEEFAVALENAGHTVTVKWWARDGFDLRDKKTDNEHPERFYDDPIGRLIFERDVRGVRECDAFVIIAGETPRAFNGANIEYGIAIACGKPCFSIGKLDNSALYWPVRQLASVRQLLQALLLRGLNQ